MRAQPELGAQVVCERDADGRHGDGIAQRVAVELVAALHLVDVLGRGRAEQAAAVEREQATVERASGRLDDAEAVGDDELESLRRGP